jgi:hypothetical protein
MQALKTELGEVEQQENIKVQLHNMKRQLNDLWGDDITIEDEDKELLIYQFNKEMSDLDIDPTDEVYLDILDILYRLGITPEELGIEYESPEDD